MQRMEAAAFPLPPNARRMRRARNRAHVQVFGNWDYDEQHQLPITQFFDYCPNTHPLHSAPRTFAYPYASSYSAYTGYVGNYNAPLQVTRQPQEQFDCVNNHKTRVVETRRQRRRRRTYLDNNSKVIDATPIPTYNDAVVTADLYDVGSMIKSNKSRVTTAKDEDLYKIPPELLRNSKRTKMRKFLAKCFMTMCASN